MSLRIKPRNARRCGAPLIRVLSRPLTCVGVSLLLLSSCADQASDIASVTELTPVRIAGESFERKLLATSLQGVVNQRAPRIYLIDGMPEFRGRYWEAIGEQETQPFWLELYHERHGVRVESGISLDEALLRFAAEAGGYVISSEDEPWTINAATTLAGLRSLLVATPRTVSTLDSVGLHLAADLRGRWHSTEECVRETVGALGNEASGEALGVISPAEYRLRDFLIANKILTVFGSPGGDGWDALLEVLKRNSGSMPVYGYLSTTSTQEALAVEAVSTAGKWLVPSDTVANLSVHSRVRSPPPAIRSSTAGACESDRLMVALVFSDGDNLALPFNRYPTERYWGDVERGKWPFGWSIPPELIDLAPAVAGYYAREFGDHDELVAMMGPGYAYPQLMLDPQPYLDACFRQIALMGMRSLWMLGPDLQDPSAEIWERIAPRFSAGLIRGVLLGYGESSPEGLKVAAGMPILPAWGSYSLKNAEIEERIRAALESYRAGGPAVVFINVTVWLNDFSALVPMMKRLSTEPDLEFVTPSQALACL